MPDIFISYAREDGKCVQLLAEALTKKGWTVWWDTGIRSGQNFRTSIQASLAQASCVVIVWSRHSVKSTWVLDEAEQGHKRNVLIPVIIEEGIDLPLGFGGIQTANITAWLKDSKQDSSFEQLCKDIAALLSESASGSQKSSAPAISSKTGKSSVFKRRIWQGIGAIFLLTAMIFLYFKLHNDPSPITAPSDISGQSKSEIPIIDKVNYAINDLWCDLPSASKKPMAIGPSEVALSNYSVDVKQHLLLDKDGKPVSIFAATSLDKLESRRLIVVHTTSQVFRAGNSFFTHILITRDGAIRQLVPFNYAANHVSNSNWRGLSPVNKHSIGIDLENAGPLQYQNNAWYSWLGATVPDDEVIRLKGDNNLSGWHKFTDAQIRAFFEVACALRRAYPTIVSIVEHSEIDAVGDPGLIFPMEEIRMRLFPRKVLQNR